MFRIAHISDLHTLAHTGAHWREVLFNKRMTGYANLLLRRGRVHRRDYLLEVLDAASKAADHVVVTGDLTNLSLESEYEEARALLDTLASRCETTVVPGNHDAYLLRVHRNRRYHHHFAQHAASDLPDLAVELPAGMFPSVKLRGPVAIVALSSAVPRPPFIAAGRLGNDQLVALDRILAHPEVARRLPVIVLHHPPLDHRIRLRQLRDGLVDAGALRDILTTLPRGLILFGHVHRRTHLVLPTERGRIDAVAATGAAIDHDDGAKRAGFNLYEISDDGSVASISAHVLDAAGSSFEPLAIPRRTLDRWPPA